MKGMLQKWVKQNVDGSSAALAEASSTPRDPVTPSSIPSGIAVLAPCRDHPTSTIKCPSAEQILADMCKALSDSQGSFHPSLSKVDALLSNDWRPPLHVTVVGRNKLSLRCAISGTSPPRAMSQIVLKL